MNSLLSKKSMLKYKEKQLKCEKKKKKTSMWSCQTL